MYNSGQQQQQSLYGSQQQQQPVMGIPVPQQHDQLYRAQYEQQQQQQQQQHASATVGIVVQSPPTQHNQVGGGGGVGGGLHPQPNTALFTPLLFSTTMLALSIACCFSPMYSSSSYYSSIYLFKWQTSEGTIDITDGYGCGAFTRLMGLMAVMVVLCCVIGLIAFLRCLMAYKSIALTPPIVMQCSRTIVVVVIESGIGWVTSLIVYYTGFCGGGSLHDAGYKLRASFGMMVAVSAIGLIAMQQLNQIARQLIQANEYVLLVYE